MIKKIPLFVINLAKDKEKKTRMQKIAKMLDVKFTFVEAIYGKDLSKATVDAVCNHEESINVLRRQLFRGEVGVAMSQMAIYKKMIDENIEEAVIFEDDVNIEPGLIEVLNSIDSFPRDWELMMLGYHRHFIKNRFHRISFRQRKKVSKNYQTVRFTDLMHGAFGYIINLKGANKLLHILEAGVIEPIDHYTGNDSCINLYGISPRCVRADIDLESTIMAERIEYDNLSKMTKKASSNKDKLKDRLQKLGVLSFVKRVNYIRGVFQDELRWLPKRLKKLKKYT